MGCSSRTCKGVKDECISVGPNANYAFQEPQCFGVVEWGFLIMEDLLNLSSPFHRKNRLFSPYFCG